jgi:predicted ATPase
VTSFGGRAADLFVIRSRFADGARLITLTGVGGVGKSRIALRAAWQLLPSLAGGAHYVDLAQ